MTDAYMENAKRLLREFPLIDGHNDFPFMLRGWYGNDLSVSSSNISRMAIGQTDLMRLQEGSVGGQFWSAFVPDARSESEESSMQILHDTLQQIDIIHQVIKRASAILGFADTAQTVLEVFRSGRVASLIGVEGLHQICGSASVLRQYHRLGVRYITLCHSRNNQYVDSATDTPQHGGLSAQGKDMIREMQRIGILVDLSHTSHDAQRRVLEISKAPVIFSHSSCYAIRANNRNVPDDVLLALKQNGGVIMICFLPSLSGVDSNGPCGPRAASVSTVVEHVLHAGTLIGYDHVGIGSDFDGMLEGPVDLDDVSAYPRLLAELLSRGVSEEDVQQVMGGNILRVLRETETYAAEQQRSAALELYDSVRPVWTEPQRKLLADKGAERATQCSDTSTRTEPLSEA